MAGETIAFRGWTSDDEIRDAMRSAKALLFPGHEDFGIVPVETQACGTPVIAYQAGGATETILEAKRESPGTGVFFSEQSVKSLVAAMLEFESEKTIIDSELARSNAEKFHTARFMNEIREITEKYLVDSSRTEQKVA